MNCDIGAQQGDGATPVDAAQQAALRAALRAQIEQRLQALFRFAGDGDAARQLLRMVLDYRARQVP